MSELRSLLDQLATLDLSTADPDALDDADLLAGLPLLQSGINQLSAVLTRAVRAAGWTTPQRMRDAPRSSVISTLGRSGYRRYDERTATLLKDMAVLVLEKYGGDLRRLAVAAGEDPERAAALVQEVKGIGPTGAAAFLREAQCVWPWARPSLDARARAGAERVGLTPDPVRLGGLVSPEELARFAAGLVRISLLGKNEDPLPDG